MRRTVIIIQNPYYSQRDIGKLNSLTENNMNIQSGEICPVCIEKRRNGVLEVKHGKYGQFLGCTQYPKCFYTHKVGKNLENQAT